MSKEHYILDSKERVEYNGKIFHLRVKTRDVSSPVVLFLHGGTGSPDRGHCSDMGNLAGCVEIAKTKDVSIVCVGNNDACESESFDRQHIKLSRESIDAIKIIANNSKKTIVVVYAGSVIDMSDWIDDVDAVVWAGYGGEFVNYALADILVGKVNPSGKISETFPLHASDVPAMNNYRDEKRLVYSEKLNVGYRYFNTTKTPVLFPFGYGLSYSQFEYSNLNIQGEGHDFVVTFDIENVSNVDGKEIAQLYVHECNPTVERPFKELKSFCKVEILAGQKASVTLRLDKRSFAYYSMDKRDWTINDGEFEIQICSNVESVQLSKVIKVY